MAHGTKRGLGKGLDALFADNSEEAGGGAVKLRLSDIEPNRAQPRKNFDEAALNDLADSIRQHGILQPLVVRSVPGLGTYQLVAGERRWRAARIAGLTEAPAIIREMDDDEAMEIALVENLQREDLNPVEEAEGYRALMDRFNLTQEQVAKRVNKSRPAVANTLRLLALPESVRGMLRSGQLSPGHARALLALDNPETAESVARLAVEKKLTVREVEKLVKRTLKDPAVEKPPSRSEKSMEETEIENGLSEQLGRKVTVNRGKKRGVLEIEFYDDDDLRELSMILGRGAEN